MITLKSWGFKYGRPEANIVFDVSYLPNPWRKKEIRECKSKQKRKKLINSFVEDDEDFSYMATAIGYAIHTYESLFPGENIIVAICCSAGEYRSPVVVEKVSEYLHDAGVNIKIEQSKYSKL